MTWLTSTSCLCIWAPLFFFGAAFHGFRYAQDGHPAHLVWLGIDGLASLYVVVVIHRRARRRS
jgi:hypothetical protein